MKTVITTLVAVLGLFVGRDLSAQVCRAGEENPWGSGIWVSAHSPSYRTYDYQHCSFCIKLYETTQWEQKQVVRHEQVRVGERQAIVGYRDVVENVPQTVYENRTVYRKVLVGHDRCGRPIYRRQAVSERVPVTRYVQVCRKEPIYGTEPIYETREVVTTEWVQVPRAQYFCLR